jgi:peptide chain release factor 1
MLTKDLERYKDRMSSIRGILQRNRLLCPALFARPQCTSSAFFVPRRYVLSSAIENRFTDMVKRHKEVLDELKTPGQSPAGIAKELSALSAVATLHEERLALDEEKVSYRELQKEAAQTKDEELEIECGKELKRIETARTSLEASIMDTVLPKDDDDFESDAIIEIRAGTGGDEAALFAGELFEAYIKTARAINWKVEVLTDSRGDLGGLREGSIMVSGRPSVTLDNGPLLGPYGVFKFESGVHRVQRVPINDTRIHTSACSVAVLPSSDSDTRDGELLPMSELRIETMRSSGAGGQHVNTTDSAVRVTHIPTGIQASIQDERSQHRNKEKAMRLIAARVRDGMRAEEEASRGAARSALMGGGDRSERIRTFNYPQDRVSDHRCKETRHGIAGMLLGGTEHGLVITFLPFLRAMRREEQLKELDEK